jgi:hypothetical protein
MRCRVQPGGYVMAKTTPDGSTRLWALGVAKTRRGLSWQFYYRPTDSHVGHRSMLCNTNGESLGEIDTDNLISVASDTAMLADEMPPVAAGAASDGAGAAKKAGALARIGSKLMRSKSVQRSESAARKAEDPDAASAAAAASAEDVAQREENYQAIAELQGQMENDVAAKETELDRTHQAEQAAIAKLDQAEAKEEDLQETLLEETEVERMQALEGSMQPVHPAGLSNAAGAMEAAAAAAAGMAAPAEEDEEEDDGPPLDRQSFLALSSLFPDVNFW